MKQIKFLFLMFVTLYTVSDLFALGKVKDAAEAAENEVIKTFFKNNACSKKENFNDEMKAALINEMPNLPASTCAALYTSALGDKLTIETYLSNQENWKQENFNASYSEFINVPEGKERKVVVKDDKNILYIYLEPKAS